MVPMIEESDALKASPAQQAERCEALYEMHRRTLGRVDRVIDEPLSQRARMLHALPWLADANSQADPQAIERFVIGDEAWGHCAFSPTICLELLVRHAARMTDRLRKHLEDYTTEWLDSEALKRFRGKNDNFPAMSACCLALAGRYFEDQIRTRQAGEVLASGVELLHRRDYLSEYLSTTYSPICVAMFAEMVEYATSDELRRTAADMETRSWRELLSHWHVASASLAGPHARSYERDSNGHINLLQHVLWTCFGEQWIPINPHDHLYPPPPEMLIHCLSLDFVRVHALWFAAVIYHPDERAVDFLRDQRLPRTEVGTAETGAFRDIVPEEAGFDPPGVGRPYPPAAHRVVSHLSEHFTLGTASRNWLNGDQHDGFIIKASTAHRERQPQPPRTLFSRFVAGGKTPGQVNHYPDLRKDGSAWLLAEEGRRYIVGHENHAMVAYWPKRRLAKAPTSRLALNLLIGCHFSRVEEVRIGEQTVGEEPVTAAAPQPLFVREGQTYIALLPLTISDLCREHAVWAGLRGRYLVIEWINYAGPERHFSEDELMAACNGFGTVVEEAGGRDFGTWCDEIMNQTTTRDETLHPDLREISFTCGDTRLATQLNPATEGVQHATVNGRAVD